MVVVGGRGYTSFLRKTSLVKNWYNIQEEHDQILKPATENLKSRMQIGTEIGLNSQQSFFKTRVGKYFFQI
jgi:hypothetical protein